jgi:hypothetical protein
VLVSMLGCGRVVVFGVEGWTLILGLVRFLGVRARLFRRGFACS